MAEINLTQEEADALFKMEKVRVDDVEWDLPDLGNQVSIPLSSLDKKEHFLLDVSRRTINLKKKTYQNRARETIILARLDFGAGHRNPDGKEIGTPHLHFYQEGYGDKWARPLPAGVFSNLDDPWQVLNDFMNYCNIVQPPNFRRDLLSCLQT